MLSPMIFSIVFGMVLELAAGIPVTHEKDGSENALKLVSASNEFAIQLFKKLPKGKNAVFSSLSVVNALCMLYAGTRGNTSKEMRSTLRFDEVQLEDNEVHLASKELRVELTDKEGRYTLEMANGAFVAEHLQFSDDYKNLLQSFYDAELDRMDFANDGPSVLDTINRWVKGKTRGKISTLLANPPDPATMMILLNAVYFKGSWKDQFDPRNTKPRPFYSPGSRFARAVPTMRKIATANYGISRKLRSKILELAYSGDRLSMAFVLPLKRNGLEDLENAMTSQALEGALDHLFRVRSISIQIPKFQLQETYAIKNALTEMGMRRVFSKSSDLGGIAANSSLTVSEVVHKASVEVNEEGSEAAAVTGVIATQLSGIVGPPPAFHADHPFLFVIRDRGSKMILFMGRVTQL